MSKTLRLLLLALLALGTALILSCGPPPVTIDDRVNMFITSLNGNRTDTYTHTDPSATLYAPARTSTFWDALFPPVAEPYSVSGLNSSNSSAVTMTINSGAGSIAYTFVMVNAKVTGSDNWLISKIMLGTTQIFY
jgi:hypothetical protein